jgi:hypothetical protein
LSRILALKIKALMSKSDEVVGKQRRNEGKKPRIVSEKKRSASAKNIRDYREKLGRSPHEKHGIANLPGVELYLTIPRRI